MTQMTVGTGPFFVGAIGPPDFGYVQIQGNGENFTVYIQPDLIPAGALDAGVPLNLPQQPARISVIATTNQPDSVNPPFQDPNYVSYVWMTYTIPGQILRGFCTTEEGITEVIAGTTTIPATWSGRAIRVDITSAYSPSGLGVYPPPVLLGGPNITQINDVVMQVFYRLPGGPNIFKEWRGTGGGLGHPGQADRLLYVPRVQGIRA